MLSLPESVGEGNMFLGCLVHCTSVRPLFRSFVRSVRYYYHDYLMNGLNNFDKNDKGHSLAATDDLVRF